MIVRQVDDRVQLITQPDHAQLARTIMEQCVPLRARPRRDRILHAIAEDDNGWAEGDATPAVDPRTGQVVDFLNAPLAVRQGVWPRAVARLAKDPGRCAGRAACRHGLQSLPAGRGVGIVFRRARGDARCDAARERNAPGRFHGRLRVVRVGEFLSRWPSVQAGPTSSGSATGLSYRPARALS